MKSIFIFALFICLFFIPAVGFASSKIVFITAGTTWTVPPDWNISNNKIEVIGGGGGYTFNGAGAGGGGAYSEITNASLTPSGTVGVSIGSGGGLNGAGGDTFLCSSTSGCSSIGDSSVIVGAKGGGNSGYPGPSPGGAASSGIGTVKYSGGASGAVQFGNGNCGGGGAAGANGNGANGGINSVGSYGGGGGGGADGGSNGQDAGGGAGGYGGNNSSGSGGGTGETPGSINPTAGTNGGGGGGGWNLAGTSGGVGTEWDSTHGSGGGGGGGGHNQNPGAGGLYGGGSGGSGNNTGPSGGQGIIVATYYVPDAAPSDNAINFGGE